MKPDDLNPFLRKPDNPNYLRRSRHHDYYRPARYMITLSKSDSIGNFGRIVGNPKVKDLSHPEKPHIALSRYGEAFESALSVWKSLYPEIDIPVYQIMPDHVHLCMDVKSYLKIGLSRAIARLMGRTTSTICANIPALDCEANAVSISSCPNVETKAFAKGFNDRIAYNYEQWERQQRYVADNPRRYLIKKLYPDLYYRRWIVYIGDQSYMAQGNIMLLKNPDIQVVRFSRNYKEGEFETYKKKWEECTRTGGVLVSPFIHPNEKAVRKEALANGGGVIRACENGFADRFCPQGEEFEFNGGCQLLLIAPMAHNSRKEEMTYSKAQWLNGIAEKIAETDWLKDDGRIRSIK